MAAQMVASWAEPRAAQKVATAALKVERTAGETVGETAALRAERTVAS